MILHLVQTAFGGRVYAFKVHGTRAYHRELHFTPSFSGDNNFLPYPKRRQILNRVPCTCCHLGDQGAPRFTVLTLSGYLNLIAIFYQNMLEIGVVRVSIPCL